MEVNQRYNVKQYVIRYWEWEMPKVDQTETENYIYFLHGLYMQKHVYEHLL